MDLQVVTVEVQDTVAVVTMDNPPVNAQDRRFHEDMMQAFDALSDRDDTRCIVLTGAGKHSSAGAEIKQRASREWEPGELWQHSRRTRECFHAIVECRKPVVAALHGATLGAGLALAASSDILVCAENTTMGLPEIDVGLLGGGRHAMRLFGHSKTRRLMFTGQRLSGAELYRLGVVEACVPPEGLMDAALEIARSIAASRRSRCTALTRSGGSERIPEGNWPSPPASSSAAALTSADGQLSPIAALNISWLSWTLSGGIEEPKRFF